MSVAVLAMLGVIIGMLFYFYSGASTSTITGRGSVYHYHYYYSHPVINFEQSGNNVTIEPYHVKTISVSCGGDNNNNLQPLNGGYKSVSGITRGLYVISSFPDPVARIWNVKIANVGSAPATVQAMTECIRDSNS